MVGNRWASSKMRRCSFFHPNAPIERTQVEKENGDGILVVKAFVQHADICGFCRMKTSAHLESNFGGHLLIVPLIMGCARKAFFFLCWP